MGLSKRPGLWLYLRGGDAESQQVLAAAYHRLSELATVVFGVALTFSIGDPTKIAKILTNSYAHHDGLAFWIEIMFRLVSPFIAWFFYVRTLIVSEPRGSWSIILMGGALLAVIPMELCAFALPMRVTFSYSLSSNPSVASQETASQLFYNDNAGSLEALFGIFLLLICASNLLGSGARRSIDSPAANLLASRAQTRYIAAFTGILGVGMLVSAACSFRQSDSCPLGYALLGLSAVAILALRFWDFQRQDVTADLSPKSPAAAEVRSTPASPSSAAEAQDTITSGSSADMLGGLVLVALVVFAFHASHDRAKKTG